MSSLLESPLIVGAAAFLVGWIMGILGGLVRSSRTDGVKSGRDHQIRALEADRRVSLKRIEELEEQASSMRAKFDDMTEESERLGETCEQRDAELLDAKTKLSEECSKTAKLRRELTGRAEETIRATMQIKDIETELDVIQAGSDVVAEQFQRLAAEREDLTDQLETLKDAGSEAESDEPEKALSKSDFILDS